MNIGTHMYNTELLYSYSEELNLESLTALLERILLQTIVCLSDERWELRRMAGQVLDVKDETSTHGWIGT